MKTSLNAFALATKFDPYVTNEQVWELVKRLYNRMEELGAEAMPHEPRTEEDERNCIAFARKARRFNDLMAAIVCEQGLANFQSTYGTWESEGWAY